MSYAGRCVFATVLAAALLAQEPGAPRFDSNVRLVLVPFHVQRGKFFAADMQPSDFILREDGHPRQFTIFEGPNTAHPLPLELILLFDTTPIRPPRENQFLSLLRVDPKAEYEFLVNWDESITREVLQKTGMDIRIAVYHYSGHQLERLCVASSDPREIVHAFDGLLGLIPQDKGELTLLPGRQILKPMFGATTWGWLNESIVGTLRDAAASPIAVRRLLIVFTTGISGTSSKSLDPYSSIVDPALAMNIPIYPVIMDLYKQQQHISGSAAPNGALGTTDPPKSQADPISAKPFWYTGLLPWFSNVGEKTGGESFIPRHLDRDALAGIIGQVRDMTLSQYVVGFVPDDTAKPKKHSLAVALSSKSRGKLIGGEKSGVEY